MNQNNRRLMIVKIGCPYIFDMMVTGKKFDPVECVEGIPEDAVFIAAWPDRDSGMVEFLFSHPSFPVAPMDANITRARIAHRGVDGKSIWIE